MDRAGLPQAMEGTRRSHERLMETLSAVRDIEIPEPSLLPGWTRGHVLTHLARNADSHVRMLSAAARGEKVEQYEGGAAGRAAAIEEGAARSAAELVDDVATSARWLFETWAAVPEQTWDEEVIAIHGGQPAWVCVFSRWRETEIHHVDLGLEYNADDWPQDFVDATLPALAETLAGRLPPDLEVDVVASDGDFKTSARGTLATSNRLIEAPARTLLAWLAGREVPPSGADPLPAIGSWL